MCIRDRPDPARERRRRLAAAGDDRQLLRDDRAPGRAPGVVHRAHPREGPLQGHGCLLYTSDAADERSSVDLGGRRIIKKKKNEE